MPLGSPVTNKFSIGTAELRVGPLTAANQLTDQYSVGVVDDVTVSVEQETAQLQAGFPRKPVDEAIVSQTTTITATMREFSRRNLNMMLGNGVSGNNVAPADVATTVTADATAGTYALTVADETGFAVDDIVVIYPEGQPEKVTVGKLETVAVGALTLYDDATQDTPLLHDYNGSTETIHVYKAFEVVIGDIEKTSYFAISVIQKDNATGRPVVFNFWKGSIASGMEYSTNAEDYASSEITITVLEPTACEYATGGDLEHLADLIPTFPVGMYANGTDAAC